MKFKYKELDWNIFIIQSDSLYDNGNDDFDDIINQMAEQNITEKNDRLKLDVAAREHLISEAMDSAREDSKQDIPNDGKRLLKSQKTDEIADKAKISLKNHTNVLIPGGNKVEHSS